MKTKIPVVTPLKRLERRLRYDLPTQRKRRKPVALAEWSARETEKFLAGLDAGRSESMSAWQEMAAVLTKMRTDASRPPASLANAAQVKLLDSLLVFVNSKTTPEKN
jgi:hypothetical protein